MKKFAGLAHNTSGNRKYKVATTKGYDDRAGFQKYKGQPVFGKYEKKEKAGNTSILCIIIPRGLWAE